MSSCSKIEFIIQTDLDIASYISTHNFYTLFYLLAYVMEVNDLDLNRVGTSENIAIEHEYIILYYIIHVLGYSSNILVPALGIFIIVK